MIDEEFHGIGVSLAREGEVKPKSTGKRYKSTTGQKMALRWERSMILEHPSIENAEDKHLRLQSN